MRMHSCIAVLFAIAIFPAQIFAYDMEEQVETNHYWELSEEDMRYELSGSQAAIVVVKDGRHVLKLLRPGDLLVRCYPMDGRNKEHRGFEVMLHVSGRSVDGSLINPSTLNEECLALVNRERTAAGVPPLTLSRDLSLLARVRAKEITERFAHVRPDGSACFTVLPEGMYATAGENIACNFPTPKDVVDGWMNSVGHRENILDPRFREMGIAVYIDPELESITYWAQLFWSR